MTNVDTGREPYSHDAPPREWGCVIETPEGRMSRTDYGRWPWSREGTGSEHSDGYVARIGWRVGRDGTADVLERAWDRETSAIRAALAGVRCDDWPAEALAVADVVAERDALRRIVGEVDLALSGAPASGQWGPRALSVHDLMSAIDADDYSDADDAVRCAQAMAAVVRDVARERIAAEQDGGAS